MLAALVESYLNDRGVLGKGLRPTQELRDAIVALSDEFTRGRDDLPKNYFSHKLYRDAYVAGFMLTNAAKVSHLLEQHSDLLPSGQPLTILDLGCGPGTAVLAASAFLAELRPHQTVHFVGVEENQEVLTIAKELATTILPSNHTVEWHVGDIASIVHDKRFDLAIAANVLNEMPAATRECRNILKHSDILIAIDPALKETTRRLMALRDQLVESGDPIVAAPCLHQRPCPMLCANDRDWCHFYLEWKRPDLIAAIDDATGLDHRYLKMGYAIFVRRGAADISPDAQHGRSVHGLSASCSTHRLVSSPLKSKGKIELILCGEDGKLRRVRRLDRHASSSNADFARVKRGDIVALSCTTKPGECRAEDVFSIIAPFSFILDA